MKTSTKLSIATALAVASSALFGIWRGHHKPQPMADKVVARQVPSEPCVTMTIQGSFDGTNWFTVTNINVVQVTNETHIPAEMLQRIQYVRMSAP